MNQIAITTVGFRKFKVAEWGNRTYKMSDITYRVIDEGLGDFATLDGKVVVLSLMGQPEAPNVPEVMAYIQDQTIDNLKALVALATKYARQYPGDKYMAGFLALQKEGAPLKSQYLLAIQVIICHQMVLNGELTYKNPLMD